jgi:hypothetical protein
MIFSIQVYVIIVPLTCSRFFARATNTDRSRIINTKIVDNVCEGGRFHLQIDAATSASGFVVDRNTFRPTPGFPGPLYPLIFQFSGATDPAAYAKTIRLRVQSIAGNVFVTNRSLLPMPYRAIIEFV